MSNLDKELEKIDFMITELDKVLGGKE